MVDILHRIGATDSSPDKAYDALTTISGLSQWWATATTGSEELGGVIQFRFVPGGFDMKVIELAPGQHVLWEVVDGPAEWIGTTVDWRITQDGGYTVILFRHGGWREPVEFMNHCSTKWAMFLMSLKAYLETGAGSPDPHDVQISNWH